MQSLLQSSSNEERGESNACSLMVRSGERRHSGGVSDSGVDSAVAGDDPGDDGMPAKFAMSLSSSSGSGLFTSKWREMPASHFCSSSKEGLKQ